MAHPLFLNDTERKKVAQLVAFANKPKHWFHPNSDKWTPGDRPEYAVTLSGYRCVFTITADVASRKAFRHLSISAKINTYPHPLVVYTIATWFGFTNAKMERDVAIKPPKDWMFHHDSNPFPFIVVLQRLTKEEKTDLKT